MRKGWEKVYMDEQIHEFKVQSNETSITWSYRTQLVYVILVDWWFFSVSINKKYKYMGLKYKVIRLV